MWFQIKKNLLQATDIVCFKTRQVSSPTFTGKIQPSQKLLLSGIQDGGKQGT
jgi:hypothetical protein